MLFDLVEQAKKLISIPSVSEEGNRGMVEELAPFCKKLGFNITLQKGTDCPTADDLNLIAHTVPVGSKDLCPQGLVMVSHLDTVPPGDFSLWTDANQDPFTAFVKDDKIYGLGSADNKLDILCKLLAVERIVGAFPNVPLEKIFKIPLTIVGTFGEERALAGARFIRETDIMHPKYALIGEPSDMKAVVAHKGYVLFKATYTPVSPPHPDRSAELTTKPSPRGEREQMKQSFKGRAAHGSMPHLGENAIEKAFAWIREQQGIEVLGIQGGTVHNIVPVDCEVTYQKSDAKSGRGLAPFLIAFEKQMERVRAYLKSHPNPIFDPPITSDNVAIISTSPAGQVEVMFNFRLIPETDVGRLFEILKALRHDVPESQVELIRLTPPMHTSQGSEIVKRVAQAQAAVGLPHEFLVKSGCTEGSIFSDMGAESIITGPSHAVGNIHAPNEHGSISQLHKAVDFYEAFLRQFC